MKVLSEDLKNGKVTVLINDLNDLWHLENIIEFGDLVTAKTLRSIFLDREGRREKVKKKLVTLKIKVEKTEFKKFSERLRIVGKIVEAPEDVKRGSYHAIEAYVGKILTIEKKWTDEHIDRLNKAKMRMKVLEDPKLIEEFYIHVNKQDGLATYGMDEVKRAADIGAIKIVLIPEQKIRDREVEELARLVESKRGDIRLVSDKTKEGSLFCKNYDIAAILRFIIS